MRWFLFTRVTQSLIVLMIMSFVIYALIGLMPGDPIDLMISANPNMTAADAVALRELFGLDLPIYKRYLNWLGTALGGDLGYSRLFGQPVLDVLFPAMKNTVVLMGTAFILSVCIAIPVGTFAASKPRSAIDYGVNLFAFRGYFNPLILAGTDADHHLLGLSRVVSRRGHCHGGRAISGTDQVYGAASSHHHYCQHWRSFALCALIHARGITPRLHSYRPRQGRRQQPRYLEACPAQRNDPGGYYSGTGFWLPFFRRINYRNNLLLAGYGKTDFRFSDGQ